VTLVDLEGLQEQLAHTEAGADVEAARRIAAVSYVEDLRRIQRRARVEDEETGL